MSNTSFSKISELMMPKRTADARSATSGSGESPPSGAAVQRFEQLLQTAAKQRPHRPGPPEPHRDSSPAPVDRPDRQRSSAERLDRHDRAGVTGRRNEDTNRVDGRNRSDADDVTATNDKWDHHDRDDRVTSDDDRATEDQSRNEENDSTEGKDNETSDNETSETATADATSASTNEVVADEAPALDGDTVLAAGAADKVEEISLNDASSEEPIENAPVNEVVGTEAQHGSSEDSGDVAGQELEIADEPSQTVDTDAETATGSSEVDAVESDRDEITGLETDSNLAATTNAAATALAPEADVIVDDTSAEVVIETGEVSAEAGLDGDAEPEIAAPLQDSGSADGEAAEDASADGADAEQSNLDGDGQPEQEQAEAGDATEVAPVTAPGQTAAVQGGGQTNTTTTPISGLTDVSRAGELGQTSGNQVASTAGSEQADGADPLWRQVRRAMGSLRNLPTGEQQLTIRLRPNDLGSVTVRISTGDAGTTVALVADSAAAASQLNQQRQQLIRELEDGGLRGVAVDVGTSGDTERSNDDPDSELDQNGRVIGGGGTGEASAENDPVRVYNGRRDGRATEGLIDVDL